MTLVYPDLSFNPWFYAATVAGSRNANLAVLSGNRYSVKQAAAMGFFDTIVAKGEEAEACKNAITVCGSDGFMESRKRTRKNLLQHLDSHEARTRDVLETWAKQTNNNLPPNRIIGQTRRNK